MDTLGSVLPTLSSLPQPFSSLNLLLAAEEEDSKRIRSTSSWWTDVRRIRGSAFPRVWRAVSVVTIWSALVAVGEFYYNKELGLTNNVTPLLSVVVGLLLVFRNGSAYARWDDGRKSFGKMVSIVRSLSRSVWINVGAPTPAGGRLKSDGTKTINDDPDLTEKDHKAKVAALRLMVAFVVATKHHIRGEYGTDYEDLNSILPSKFNELARTTGFGFGAAEADAQPRSPTSPTVPTAPENLGQEIRRLTSRHSLHAPSPSHPSSPSQSTNNDHSSRPPLSPRSITSFASRRSGERRPLLRHDTYQSTESAVILANHLSKPSLPLPLICAHQLQLYLAQCKRKGLLESVGPAGYNAMSTSVAQLVDGFTNVEKLATVGIPTVYGIHLSQCVSLFLFTLPFTLVETLRWKMVPFITLVAFLMIGIEGIASEIEQPFGYDDSDLPIDLFCAELRNEVEHTIACLSAQTDDWML